MSDVTAYTMTVKCMNYCYGGSPALEVDEYPNVATVQALRPAEYLRGGA